MRPGRQTDSPDTDDEAGEPALRELARSAPPRRPARGGVRYHAGASYAASAYARTSDRVHVVTGSGDTGGTGTLRPMATGNTYRAPRDVVGAPLDD